MAGITLDFHGWRTEDALREVELQIGDARSSDMPAYAEYITGNGRIKRELLQLLDTYGIEGREKLGNSGVIVATLE